MGKDEVFKRVTVKKLAQMLEDWFLKSQEEFDVEDNSEEQNRPDTAGSLIHNPAVVDIQQKPKSTEQVIF